MALDAYGNALPGEQGDLSDGTRNQTREPDISTRIWLAGQALGMYLSCDEMQRQLADAVDAYCTENPEKDRRSVARKIIAKRVLHQADAIIAQDKADAMLAERKRREQGDDSGKS